MKLRVIAKRHTPKFGDVLVKGNVVERDKSYLKMFPGVFEPYVPEIHEENSNIVKEGYTEVELVKMNRVGLEEVAKKVALDKSAEYDTKTDLAKAILAKIAGEPVPEPVKKDAKTE